MPSFDYKYGDYRLRLANSMKSRFNACLTLKLSIIYLRLVFYCFDQLIAQVADADGVKVFKFSRWRQGGVVLADVMEKYRSVDAELNVLPYCTQFIPMDVITHPVHQSIIYHPSLLPLHRGASAINWLDTCLWLTLSHHSY